MFHDIAAVIICLRGCSGGFPTTAGSYGAGRGRRECRQLWCWRADVGLVEVIISFFNADHVLVPFMAGTVLIGVFRQRNPGHHHIMTDGIWLATLGVSCVVR